MRDLIERLEKATGPDRELDCEIYVATSPSPFVNYYPDCVLASLGGFAARVEIKDIPAYTASLDAAMTLVPAEWFTDLLISPPGTSCSADLTANDGKFLQQGDTESHGTAITAPLAICVAALRARLK